MPLTLKQIMKVTPKGVRDRSKKCITARVGNAVEVKDKKRGQVIHEQYKTKCTATTRKAVIQYLAKSKKDLPVKDEDSPVWVSCDCEFFLFNCEYALAKKGSSSILYSDGKPPVVKNPKQIPYACKHLYRSMMASLTTYRKK